MLQQPDTEKIIEPREEQLITTQPVRGAFIKEILDDKTTQLEESVESADQEKGRNVKVKSKPDFVEPPIARSAGTSREVMESNKIKRSMKVRQTSPKKVNQKIVKPTNIGFDGASQEVHSMAAPKKIISKQERKDKMSSSYAKGITKPESELVPKSYQQQDAKILQSKIKHNKNSVYGSPKTLVQMYSLDDSLTELTHGHVNVEDQGQRQNQGQRLQSGNHAEPVPYYYSMGHSSYRSNHDNIHEGKSKHILLNDIPVNNEKIPQVPVHTKSLLSQVTEEVDGGTNDQQMKSSGNNAVGGLEGKSKQIYMDPRSETPVTQQNPTQVF